MSRQPYLTAPIPSAKMPPGIPYIIGNEAAERFSYYGMRTVLIPFMTKYMLDASGNLDVLTGDQAKEWYHLFLMAVYGLPLLGALLSDGLLGKYRTIFWLSLVYCAGHATLAINDTRWGLAIGLSLIALGAGGIKPCVSANVGDQFGAANQHFLERAFFWFYFAINFGSTFSTLLTPWLLRDEQFGPRWAFGVPGVLMFLATVVFWLGRHKFVHIPPGGEAFVRESFSGAGLAALRKMAILVLFVAMFWSLYDQSSSAWVLQAEQMDRRFLGFEPHAEQIQVVNPILIMLFIPLFAYVIYPAVNRVYRLTPLRKIGIGFWLTIAAFVLSAWVQQQIDHQAPADPKLSIGWQLAAWVLLTAAEMMVSVTCLEFFYSQAPLRMKSIVMSIYLLSNSIGNGFTSLVNHVIQNDDGTSKLAGASYYWFFVGIMLVTTLLFTVYAQFFRMEKYIQREAAPPGS